MVEARPAEGAQDGQARHSREHGQLEVCLVLGDLGQLHGHARRARLREAGLAQ